MASFARWEDAFRAGLASMREHGLLRPDADAATLARATLASLEGGLLLCQTRKGVTPLDVALDALANLRSHAEPPELERSPWQA